ncbi:MAG: putative lipid II flippase FtsW [Candidatus Acididesulfobacter diazotrophicus]|uniref:Probable peptidoglycan glycosyltransferase FtsW n=1 Tax=Candidatus Acididesulfobacter diazotrophicus TaxID=2597226 RepID=A0A519BND6_9DELT|nr:MAG: putative lipid II flippase FtsW [Candidatus Acididesulfobacter diazotrophicus]
MNVKNNHMINYGKAFIRKYDTALFLSVCILIALGLVMVYSTSAMTSIIDYGNSYHFLMRQGIYVIISAVFMGFFMKNDYHILKSFYAILLVVVGILMLLVFIPHIGLAAGGSRRWINLKLLNLEPSEFLKVIFIIFLAVFLEKKKELLNKNRYSLIFIAPMLVMVFFDIFLLKEPDFGTASVLFAITLIMLFAGGVSLIYIVSILLFGSAAAYLLIFSVAYRRDRILAFLHPFKDKTGIGFQIIQSMFAFARGGMFGVGLGNGKEKLFFLPTPYSDFIFSTVGEELGFIGVLIFIALYFILAYRGLKIALYAPDLFGTYLALGLTGLLVISAFINIGVVTDFLPTKGLALPFVSYGGSALLASAIAVGILLNISSQSLRKKKD